MPSHLKTAPRRVPQQARGERRVAAFLGAAADVLAEVGYEQATMSAIAERADSCIGSLYQFFPNKRAVAEALRARHLEAVEQSWVALSERAAGLSADELANSLVDVQLDNIERHPALLALMELPPTSRSLARRKIIRARIAQVLRAHRPDLPELAIRQTATVVQHVSRSMLVLYARSEAASRAWILDELRTLITGYLVPKVTTTV